MMFGDFSHETCVMVLALVSMNCLSVSKLLKCRLKVWDSTSKAN